MMDGVTRDDRRYVLHPHRDIPPGDVLPAERQSVLGDTPDQAGDPPDTTNDRAVGTDETDLQP